MYFMFARVSAAFILSIAFVGFVIGPAHAHEVMPTIADMSHSGEVRLVLRLNGEAFVAGINLDVVSDTNESPENADYDTLRALAPDVFADRLRAALPNILENMPLSADGTRLALREAALDVQDPGDFSLARTTLLTLTADLPPDTQALSLGWGQGFGSLVLRQQGPEVPFTGLISPGTTSPEISLAGQGAPKSAVSALLDYIPVGFDHILPKGLDHILFVLALFFLSTKLSTLLWQVSAFTIAHTVTLAAGAMGLVSVPSAIVEPLIAASIAFVAVENILNDRLSRWRPVVIFGFGLLHGLGFASVLQDFGLPADQFVPALIGFNIGVEIGQLTTIAIAFLAVGLWFGRKSWYRARIAVPASAIIGLIGAYWVVERTLLS